MIVTKPTMDLKQSVHQLLSQIGPGRMTSAAYDTAWVARLGDIDPELSNNALDWICENQLPDGSWGASAPYSYHDRLICTLASMVVLAQRGRRAKDRRQFERAQPGLEMIITQATTELLDPALATVGFEMIVPTLLTEAKDMGLIHYAGNGVLNTLIQRRSQKLASLPNQVISRQVTVAFSSEMAGADKLELLDVENLQEANGSVLNSPSATAYFALYVHPKDSDAMRYLHRVVKTGGAPNVAPIDVFEPAWVLWNLSLPGPLDRETLDLSQRHLDTLSRNWLKKAGIGHASDFTPKDGDDTGLVYEVLSRFGRPPDLEAVLSYEEDECFRCYAFEANPSISTNIHVLGALRQAGLGCEYPSVRKILRFLRQTQTSVGCWFDKWHASPYYATAHALIAQAGYCDELVPDALSWIIHTQNSDGSWGYYMPTAEETAYCLQALFICQRNGKPVPANVIYDGVAWLMDNAEPPYAPLWIGKCLYCPELVVRSAIIGALMFASQ